MTTDSGCRHDTSRYRGLGLVANPFTAEVEKGAGVGAALEIEAASNRLLGALVAASGEDAPKPIVVGKTTGVPSYYLRRAIGRAESVLINDESLNLLHAYIQLYMMRKGRVRSTLATVSERIAFRSFDQTLAAYIARVLDSPDDELASYKVLGADALTAFADQFRVDPVAVTNEYFGEPELERRPELAQVADLRLSGLEADVTEAEDTLEFDATVADAPGAGMGLPEADTAEQKRLEVADYIIEYTSAHLSKVVARGFRVYRERGLAAMSSEWRITKAPRKTLVALAGLAAARFDRLVIVYDEFESWLQIPAELRRTIVMTLSEMRWMLDGSTVLVFLLEDDAAPELEEQFSAGRKIRWDFPGLEKLQNAPDAFDPIIVGDWIQAATVAETAPTLDDPVLSALADEAGGSLRVFVSRAAVAIEDAAQRGVSSLDDRALDAGRAHVIEDAEL